MVSGCKKNIPWLIYCWDPETETYFWSNPGRRTGPGWKSKLKWDLCELRADRSTSCPLVGSPESAVESFF